MEYDWTIPFTLYRETPEGDLIVLGRETCLTILFLPERDDLWLTHPCWGSLLLSPGQCKAARPIRPA